MEWLTTSTILQRLHDFQDKSMWDGFTRRFRRPLLSFAVQCGIPASEADDVTQEVLVAFAEAYRKGKYDASKGRLSSWLFGIAYRQIANHRRRRAREQIKRDQRSGHSSFWMNLPDRNEASRAWDLEWETAIVESCLRQARREVSKNTYRAFELVVRKERPAEEVAAELGLSRNAVYLAKHRVLKRLEELMRDYEELRPE